MNKQCLFVSDLHGKVNRYERLFKYIRKEKPGALFIGGDILPSSIMHSFRAGDNKPDFVTDFLAEKFQQLKQEMEVDYPAVYIIMGNDDPRIEEVPLINFQKKGLWNYAHGNISTFHDYQIMGYAYVPPTPFLLKDWERYDIGKEVQPGCIPPTEGFRTWDSGENQDKSTIRQDLKKMANGVDFSRTISMFHSPPYQCGLDRAALDGVTVNDQPVDVHVGSKAIREFIEQKKPFLSLHGHIHESSRLTGVWKEKIDSTIAISAAFEGPGLAVIKFNMDEPFSAERIIL
ncbi:MAG: metallophosphoesterase [Bacteroidales bacterium]